MRQALSPPTPSCLSCGPVALGKGGGWACCYFPFGSRTTLPHQPETLPGVRSAPCLLSPERSSPCREGQSQQQPHGPAASVHAYVTGSSCIPRKRSKQTHVCGRNLLHIFGVPGALWVCAPRQGSYEVKRHTRKPCVGPGMSRLEECRRPRPDLLSLGPGPVRRSCQNLWVTGRV